jgi:hypothetical protein
MKSNEFFVANQFTLDRSRQPVFVAATCGGCLKVCVTYNNNDTEKCNCLNKLVVFGGLSSYPAYTCKDKRIVTEHIVYADDDFEVVRIYATRGTRGINNDEPLWYIAISKMTDNHLASVLEYGGADWHLKLIARELQYRFENKFKINEHGEIENY